MTHNLKQIILKYLKRCKNQNAKYSSQKFMNYRVKFIMNISVTKSTETKNLGFFLCK